MAGTATAASAWQQIAASGSSDGSGNLLISLSAGNTSGAYVDWDDVTVSAVEPANPVATWAQTFGYDGFGNLLSETPTAGSAPHVSINVDTATNRVVATGVQYDAAGNMIDDGTQAYTFDEANRLKTAGNYFYTYSGLENKRVIAYNGNGSTPSATINLYGPDGKRLGYYRFFSTNGWSKTNSGSFQNFLYLGNKALTYTEDRIGSTGNYFPYGNGYNVTGAEVPAFGTYVQDESGLLYADQRYYTAGFGRFMTADRSNANIDYGNPVSWNRYAYTNGDPVNGMDPTGQDDDPPSPDSMADTHAGGLIGADTCSSGFCGDGTGDGTPLIHVDVVCGPSCGAGQPVIDLPPATPDTGTGSPDWIDLSPPTQANCVAQYVAVGTALGAGAGSTAGSAGGALAGGAAGSLIEPGGGTAVGVWLGGEVGSTGGALAGGSLGGAFGGLFGNILCSKGGTQNIRPTWAEGYWPQTGETGSEFAKRVCDDVFGPGNYNTGPGGPLNILKKWFRDKFGGG